MKHRWFAIPLCAALVCACLSGALAENPADPFVVQVGDVGYTLSEVQGYWNSLAASYLALGETIDMNQLEWYEKSVIETYVKMGVLQNKLIEFGLDRMTADDEKLLELKATALYNRQLDAYAEEIAAKYDRTLEESRQYAQTLLELDGYTMDTARGQALSELKEKRILDRTTADVAKPTADEVESFYREQLVVPSQEAYATSRETFDESVALYGATTYYYPSGYRFVRQILLPASTGAYARAKAQAQVVADAKDAVQTAKNALYGLQVLGEDEDEAKLALSDAEAALQTEQAALDAIYAENLLRYDSQIKDIQARLSAGETFDDVMRSYEKDETMPEAGYLVSADSHVWEDSFRDGAMALKAIGDVSAPVCTIAGVHILQYTADAPNGSVPLEGELREQVTDAAYQQRRYKVLEGFIEQWRTEYQVTTRIGLLDTPDCLR